MAHGRTPLVLIADTQPYICRVFEAKLTKEDQFQVFSATTGAAVLHAALRQPFDVILWDLRLHDTETLLPQVRALCPQATLLLTTTDDRPLLNSEMARLDVADILVKPFGLEALLDRVKAAMEAPQIEFGVASVELTHIGQRLEILSPHGVCHTRVLENRQDTFLVVGAPRVETPEDFTQGQRVTVQINGEDALYSFGSRLANAVSIPVPGWEMPKPRVIRRAQRRKHPRRPLSFSIVLKDCASLETARSGGGTLEFDYSGSRRAAEECTTASGVTEDMSLQGCALISDHRLSVGTKIEFDLTATHQNLTGEGHVVRLQSLVGTGSQEAYRIVVEFAGLNVATRRRLRSLLQSGG